MKKLGIVLVAIILLSLSAFAEKSHNSGKMYAMANNALVEPVPFFLRLQLRQEL